MVFPKRHLIKTSTQCTRKRKSTACGGGNTIHTDATTEVPAAAAAAAEIHTTAAVAGVHITAAAAAANGVHIIAAAAISATERGLCFQTPLYYDYIRAHILWQDTFLQSSFATMSVDDMSSSRENYVALQTLATAI